jgi:hypothetical protein
VTDEELRVTIRAAIQELHDASPEQLADLRAVFDEVRAAFGEPADDPAKAAAGLRRIAQLEHDLGTSPATEEDHR